MEITEDKRMLFPLCRLDDLEEPGSAGFTVYRGEEALRLLVVRKGGQVYGYVNQCPHVRLPLDFRPGQFLDFERTHILCTNHCALFRIEDGLFIAGPCRGQTLTPIPVTIANGNVVMID